MSEEVTELRQCRPTLVLLMSGLMSVGSASAQTEAVDRRSHELIRRECRAVIDSEDVTLFENGTIRLISRHSDQRFTYLAELTNDEVQAFVQRVREVDLSEENPSAVGLEGDWIEQCELYLDVADSEPVRFRYGRYDSLSLPLSRANRVADDLLTLVQDRAPTGGLPRGYVPKPGDILERVDGVLFEVIGLTGDKKGIELVGVEQPLVIFVLNEAIGEQFTALLERRKFP